MKKIYLLLLLTLLPLTVLLTAQSQEPGKPDDSAQSQPQIPVPDELAIERRDFMRTKLLYSQNIFEGLTIRDFDLIKRSIRDTEQLLEAEEWVAIDNEDYRRLTDEFKTALKRLKITAKTENVEATALRFYELSTRCIDCHQHLRHAKYQF
jgi:hypothetical protein